MLAIVLGLVVLGRWRWGNGTFKKRFAEGGVYFDESKVYMKERASATIEKYPEAVLDQFLNTTGTNELKILFNDRVFSFPKPVSLIDYLLRVGTDSDSLILDFFSGSGTTAHAVMQLNIKTYYKVDFETAELIEKAIKAIDKHLSVTEIRMVVEEGVMEEIRDKEQLEAGTAMKQTKAKTYNVRETLGTGVKYDLIGRLVMETGLTRKTLVAILKGIRPKTFDQFRMNPEEFIRKTANIINDEKAMAVVQKICYQRTGNTYDVDIFTENTIRGKVGINAIESTKSLYDLVVVDSEGVEKQFAEALETHAEVAVYTKLPKGFYIHTPMGHYNPDWAIAFNEGTVKHIYFIAETKGNEWQRSQLRGAEDAKLECAARHFEAISQGGNIVYGVAKDYKTLYDKVMK